MSQKLEVGDKITVYTKTGHRYSGSYCYLPRGYIGISELRLAIPRENIKAVVRNEEKK